MVRKIKIKSLDLRKAVSEIRDNQYIISLVNCKNKNNQAILRSECIRTCLIESKCNECENVLLTEEEMELNKTSYMIFNDFLGKKVAIGTPDLSLLDIRKRIIYLINKYELKDELNTAILGHCYLAIGEPHKAYEILKPLEEYYKDDSDFLQLLFEAEIQVKNFFSAEENIKKVFAKGTSEYYFHLGVLKFDLKEYKESMENFEKSQDTYDGQIDYDIILYYLCTGYKEIGEYKKAISAGKEMLNSSSEIEYVIENKKNNAKDFDDWERSFYVSVYKDLIFCYIKEKNLGEARKMFDKINEIEDEEISELKKIFYNEIEIMGYMLNQRTPHIINNVNVVNSTIEGSNLGIELKKD